MGRPAGWMTTVTGRPVMRSPGRPPVRRESERRFWLRIADGLSSEDAAAACGVSPAVGNRWFRQGGGMSRLSLVPPSGRYLWFPEREEFALLRAQEMTLREIARRLDRAPSTIWRELRRNAATRSGRLDYRASIAQWKAELMARRPKPAKLASNARLHNYVQTRLAGEVEAPDGTTIPGPAVRWIGRRHGRRQDRRWSRAWSPEQISHRLRVDFADDESMRISHEAIYQALFVQGRGALRRELAACLRTGRALRVPRARTRGRANQTPRTLAQRRAGRVGHPGMGRLVEPPSPPHRVGRSESSRVRSPLPSRSATAGPGRSHTNRTSPKPVRFTERNVRVTGRSTADPSKKTERVCKSAIGSRIIKHSPPGPAVFQLAHPLG